MAHNIGVIPVLMEMKWFLPPPPRPEAEGSLVPSDTGNELRGPTAGLLSCSSKCHPSVSTVWFWFCLHCCEMSGLDGRGGPDPVGGNQPTAHG